MRSIKAQILITGPLTQAYGKRFTQRIAALWLRDNGVHHVLNCKKPQCRKTRAFLHRGLLEDALKKEGSISHKFADSSITTVTPYSTSGTTYIISGGNAWSTITGSNL